MARAESPNSANSQFFIMLAPRMTLDNKYSAFGRVVEGMAAVDSIAVGEPPAQPTRIVRATIGGPLPAPPVVAAVPAPAPEAAPTPAAGPSETTPAPAPEASPAPEAAPAPAAEPPAATAEPAPAPAPAAPAEQPLAQEAPTPQ
jgi:peptidylprolyl isomerase